LYLCGHYFIINRMQNNEKDHVREQILDAASAVFAKYGYKKATMDDIGHAIKKGKTAVYYYFNGKEDIFRGIVEREANMLGKSIVAAIEKGKSASDKFAMYIHARVNTLQKVSNFYDAMKNELLDSLEFINQARQTYDAFEISLVSSILSQGNKEGSFNVKDCNATAELIVTILKGLEIHLFVVSDQTRLQQKTEEIILSSA